MRDVSLGPMARFSRRVGGAR